MIFSSSVIICLFCRGINNKIAACSHCGKDNTVFKFSFKIEADALTEDQREDFEKIFGKSSNFKSLEGEMKKLGFLKK